MAKVDLVMPKMGESIMEATILKWNKQVGDTVEMDETILEIATDKVDSEIPSPVDGKIIEILYEEDAVVEIGKVIAIIATEGEEAAGGGSAPAAEEAPTQPTEGESAAQDVPFVKKEDIAAVDAPEISSSEDRFYSPLVKSIARAEGVGQEELDGIKGTGAQGRVTKRDILAYLESRTSQSTPTATASKQTTSTSPKATATTTPAASISGDHEIIEMDRMRKRIAEHMVMSKQTSPHVTSFVEADVTNIVNWRNRIKKNFQATHGEKITFTPIFIEAVAKAIKDFPLINITVDGDKIIVKKDINIGMAAALPSGNLIVPVIKNADHLSLIGLTKKVNDLARRARDGKLLPDEIQGGTYTLTNVGTFGNVLGTPIINQPQVAIMATGAIQKKPAVLETPEGDVIAIRHKMFLSHSYDHRVVDGALGGTFVRRVADYLEAFDPNRDI